MNNYKKKSRKSTIRRRRNPTDQWYSDLGGREERKIVTCVSRQVSCPDRMIVDLRYAEPFLSFSGAVSGDQVYNLNSCFDPDRIGGGHQPQGFDQWSAFYNRYRVLSCLVQVDFVNSSAGTVTKALVTATNNVAAILTALAYNNASENPGSWTTMMATSAGNNIKSFKKRFYPHQITGVTRAQYDVDDRFQALTSADPTELIVVHICAQDFAFTSNITMEMNVRLTYNVEMWDRNQLLQS